MTAPPKTPPSSETELLARAQALAGLSLGELASAQHYAWPRSLKRAKGWIGELLETALGATAGSRPEPDFPHLGIELKTLPVRNDGQPKESTFVCVLSLSDRIESRWEDSLVQRKLARVLWVPVQHDPGIEPEQRRIGTPSLWSPTTEEEIMLRTDWEELTDLIREGQLAAITARHGHWLQIRPKAANGRALTSTADPELGRILTLPRGFYLRTRFTARILKRQYA
jgi:DNA mismatch repair protein MutH